MIITATFKFIIDEENQNWKNANEEQRKEAVKVALKEFNDEIERIHFRQGVFSLEILSSQIS